MKRIVLLILLILFVTGIVSPFFGKYHHTLADEIAYKTACLRCDGPLSDLEVHIINAASGNPYLLPSELVQSNNQEIILLEKKIVKGKVTDEEKSKAIYYWITHHITYDYGGNPADKEINNRSFKSSLETLLDRSGICIDYAILNAALHRAAGIEARIVYGEKHAWNQVKIGKVWIDQDTTTGSGYMDENNHRFIQQYDQDYFNKTDKRWEGEYGL